MSPTSLDGLTEEVKRLQSQVTKLLAESDTEAVKFCDLGFRQLSDVKLWRETELKNKSYGLIVDVHLVLEHVYAMVYSGSPDLGDTDLVNLRKIQITNMIDGMAFRSFRHRIPKYFSKNSQQGLVILKDNESYLDCLPSFEKWNDPTTGGRAVLKEALESFRISFHRIIAERLDQSSRAYQVACLACTLSTTWLTELMSFMEDLQLELTRSRFSSANAWNLVTRLVHRIFIELSGPRMGVSTQHDSEEADLNANMILWAVSRSHDIMARYQRHAFKNDPSISAEYVKFLITHSGNDVVDGLTSKVKLLSDEVTKVSKVANTVTTALNRVDENKKALAILEKKVEKLVK